LGVYPRVFAKSAQVIENQWLGDIWNYGVCK
jgi:hypothetical protein